MLFRKKKLQSKKGNEATMMKIQFDGRQVYSIDNFFFLSTVFKKDGEPDTEVKNTKIHCKTMSTDLTQFVTLLLSTRKCCDTAC